MECEHNHDTFYMKMSETKWTLISKQMVQKTKTKKSCDILEIIFNVYTDFFFNVCTLFTPLVENTQSFLFLPSVVFGSTSVSTTMVPQLTLYLNSKLTYYLEIGPLGSNLLFGLQQRERKKKKGEKGGWDLLLGKEMGRVPNEEQ